DPASLRQSALSAFSFGGYAHRPLVFRNFARFLDRFVGHPLHALSILCAHKDRLRRHRASTGSQNQKPLHFSRLDTETSRVPARSAPQIACPFNCLQADAQSTRGATLYAQPFRNCTAEMTTNACAIGYSSVMAKSIWGSNPAGTMARRRQSAAPASCMVGRPDGRFTTPRSRKKIPPRNPFPSALAQASLAAKRLA